MSKREIHEFDAIIIGSGQGGKPLSIDLAEAGWKTALIERGHLGGSCINTGCTPTKTIIASARAAHLIHRGNSYGIEVDSAKVNITKVRDRKRGMVESFRNSAEEQVEKTEGLVLLRGEGRFTSSHEVEVALNDGERIRLRSGNIIVDVGSRPAVPVIEGLESVPYLNSTTITELDAIPEHLIIIGGGYIALEFGQAFRRFGSRVTIIQRAGQLLGREDHDVASEMAKILSEDGIDIVLETRTRGVKQKPDGTVEVTTTSSGDHGKISGSHILIATGRLPNSEALNPGKAGIEVDERGYIKTNEFLETSVEGIYAIGDVKGGPAFTHISYDDYRILRANLLDGARSNIRDRLVPYTLFTDPQLGRVGLSESEAKAKGGNIGVAKLPMNHVARALETGETRGFMKAVIDMESKHILGCAILGVNGGEVMNMLQIAMIGKLPYTTLRDMTFAHPTLGESLNSLFGSIEN